MQNKKGQDGGGAAALVAIIALLIVLYVLFLPPDIRQDLLDDRGSGGSTYLANKEAVLLSESPGRLDFLSFKEYEHDISPIYLLKTSQSAILKTWNSFTVRSGVFDKKFYATRFSIGDLEHTNNILLSFIVRESQGDLIIKLNGEQIYDGKISSFNPDPFLLPPDLIKEDNLLEFEVSSVGWRFWSTNTYTIENMKVVAQITDTSRQESRNVFVVRDMEYFNLDSALLKFTPACNRLSVGQLQITLNGHELFDGIPDCGIPNTKEFSPALLNRGENKVIFKTAKGSYLIDGIMVKTQLKEQNYPLYSFSLNDTYWQDLVDGRLDLELRLHFLDEPGRKQGIVYFNGMTLSFSTTDKEWSKSITGQAEEGDNWVKLTPDRNVLDVTRLEVVLVGRN
ncbi:MAG: hypothetical protein GXP63_06915, partial [DPANN group archaeon]|nr:hypothetical protein [DPANN group archaeon]